MNTSTTSRRHQAGSRRNKKMHHVGSFGSDSRTRPDWRTVQQRQRTQPTTGQAQPQNTGQAAAPTPVALYSLADLTDSTMAELREVCHALKIHGYSSLKKAELIEFIYQHPRNVR